MSTEISAEYISKLPLKDQYPFLINDILKYIDHMKKIDNSIPLFDIIIEYAFKYEIDIDLIGDAISNDVYFKSFIEKDCKVSGLLKDKSHSPIEKW